MCDALRMARLAPLDRQLHLRKKARRRFDPTAIALRAGIPAERFGACKGDMRTLDALRLVCSGCGARDWHASIFSRAGEAEAWLEGAVLSLKDGGRPAF
jgi:hypothetical protein